MSGKLYRRLNAELAEAVEQHENGQITDAELSEILRHTYKEYKDASAKKNASEGEHLLKLILSI